MTTTTRIEYFTTSDLGLAAFLIAGGYPLRGLSGLTGHRRTFRFDAAAALRAPEFYSDGTVPARDFANALRDLKTLLREA